MALQLEVHPPGEDDDAASSRLEDELALLTSIYPSELSWHAQRRELVYLASPSTSITTSTSTADTANESTSGFTVRLPASYPTKEPPQVLSAHAGRIDLRDELKQGVAKMDGADECLDAIVAAFTTLVESTKDRISSTDAVEHSSTAKAEEGKTVIIYLHHLLALSKRKLALHPSSINQTSSTSGITGISKPGYPGVLLFAGPAATVDAHVTQLKGLNWAAFQVRYDSSFDETGALASESWTFGGDGIIEVQGMGDVVTALESGAPDGKEGARRKEVFLKAMRMK